MPVCGSGSEYALPPMCARRSTTRTRLPSCVATRSAIVRPKNPEPTTKRSKRAVIGSQGIGPRRPHPGPDPPPNGPAPKGSKVAIASRFHLVTLVTSITSVPSNTSGSQTRNSLSRWRSLPVPNRRRRKLSTAMSAVAALAVASPFALSAVSEMTASQAPAPEQHDFVQAAMVTDLPGDVMSALQSSLSQFGIVVPNLPSGILGPSSIGTNPPFPQGAPTPGLTAPTPGLTAPANAP